MAKQSAKVKQNTIKARYWYARRPDLFQHVCFFPIFPLAGRWRQRRRRLVCVWEFVNDCFSFFRCAFLSLCLLLLLLLPLLFVLCICGIFGWICWTEHKTRNRHEIVICKKQQKKTTKKYNNNSKKLAFGPKTVCFQFCIFYISFRYLVAGLFIPLLFNALFLAILFNTFCGNILLYN